jgi:hypothetical protein
MIDGCKGTRVSCSVEEDGSELAAALEKANRGQSVVTAIFGLAEESDRQGLRDTANQILAVLDNEEATHMALEIHGAVTSAGGYQNAQAWADMR